MFRLVKTARYLILILLAAHCLAPARSGDMCNLIVVNSLSEEIVTFRVRYSTPYGTPRHTSSTIFLPPGGDYRLGVQGTTLPERIILDLATKSYDFPDLSGVEAADFMHLEAVHQDGVPILRRLDQEDLQAKGVEHDYLTSANRPNAVDRDFLTGLKTWDKVVELVQEKTEGERERLGQIKTADVEAGPIWNQAHALERCPEAITEWAQAHPPADLSARWTGHWTTTVPNEMSVCGCMEGTADLAGTLFEENAGWGRTLYFPLFWRDWQGVARVQAMDKDAPEEGLGFDLRFRLEDAGESGVAVMLDDLMSDLRVDGYRPWSFSIKTGPNPEMSEEYVAEYFPDGPKEEDIYFKSAPGDMYDANIQLQESLFTAYGSGTLYEAVSGWVKEEAFAAAKSGEEVPASPGVMLLFSRGTFEAVFIPDGRMLMAGGE